MTNNHPTLSVDPYYDGVPAYMTEVYDWAYVDPKWVQALDRNIVVRILLFLNDQRLMRAYLNEITPGMKVWQVAHVDQAGIGDHGSGFSFPGSSPQGRSGGAVMR